MPLETSKCSPPVCNSYGKASSSDKHQESHTLPSAHTKAPTPLFYTKLGDLLSSQTSVRVAGNPAKGADLLR